MTTDEETGTEQILAGGTVLWRQRGDAPTTVAVIHRPRYDDWTLPKGKCEPGETLPACAVRETEEETGFRGVLGRPLGQVRYRLDGSTATTKLVAYYAARAASGGFQANAEVDALRWLPIEQARDVLDYPADRAVLARFASLPAATRTVLLVRHAKAGRRSTASNGADVLRPLSPCGWTQAAALRTLLSLFGPDRVHATPRLRCVQTVEALAADLGVQVVLEPPLTEEAYSAHQDAAVARLVELVEAGGTPVICGQGGWIPGVIDHLAAAGDVSLDGIPCKKGSVWVLSFAPDEPRLVAADYLPSALPVPTPVWRFEHR